MASVYCQEDVTSFSIEDWARNPPVAEDMPFTACLPLDVMPKKSLRCDWSRPVQDEASHPEFLREADRDIRAGRIAAFDSIDAMIASLKTSPR